MAQRANEQQCRIFACVKAHNVESCRTCRATACPVLESGDPVRCGLADYFAGERGGTSLVKALSDLRSLREEHLPSDMPPRLIQRLPRYLAALHELAREGVQYVASAELALRIGTSPALVRKDLSTVGQWGRRSAGYRVDVLTDNLRRAAGLHQPRHAAWLGCEHLVKYPTLLEEFRCAGCIVSAAFCEDGKHIGQQVDGLIVKPVEDLPLLAKTLDLTVAVVAVEPERAQGVAELAASAGVRFILNLTNKILSQPRGATVENVSPLQGLISLLLRTPGPEHADEDKESRRNLPS